MGDLIEYLFLTPGYGLGRPSPGTLSRASENFIVAALRSNTRARVWMYSGMLYPWMRYLPIGAKPGASLIRFSQRRSRFQPSLYVHESEPRTCDVLEVWFAGCHSDVGGGAAGNGIDPSLATISLWWMVKQVSNFPCGILFDHDALTRTGLIIPTTAPLDLEIPNAGEGSADGVRATSSTSQMLPNPIEGVYVVQEERLKVLGIPPKPREGDILADVNDEMKIHPLRWFILEIIPVKYEWQGPNKEWRHKWGCVPVNSVRFNWSPLSGATASQNKSLERPAD